MPVPKQFSCSTCGKWFSRLSHVKRHEQRHTHYKPYRCTRCGRRYSRGDTLKRHSLVCPGDKWTRQYDESLHEDLERRSTATNHSHPAIHDEPRADVKVFSDYALCLQGRLSQGLVLSQQPAVSFKFLRIITSNPGIRKAFRVEDKPREVENQQHLMPATVGSLRNEAINSIEPSKSFLLGTVVQTLVDDLILHATRDDRYSRIRDFFSTSKTPRFLEYYWSNWHQNVPLIHPRSFDILSTPPPLIATMAVIGACHSPSAADRRDAKLHYDLVERYIFAHLDSYRTFNTTYDRHSLIKALQAAYLVMVYQSWDGDPSARVNVRRHGFAQIIELIQTTGIGSTRHIDYRHVKLESFDWPAFIESEELIRLLVWCFLVDCAFSIFFNLPPRIALRQLQMGPPAPEACFYSESAEECLSHLYRWQYQTNVDTGATLYELIKTALTPSLALDAQVRLASQSTITHFCLISALHVILFNADPCTAIVTRYTTVCAGLENWQTIWNRRKMLGLNSEPRELGFWRHCPDYWLLAKLLVHRVLAEDVGTPGAQRFKPDRDCYDEESQKKLHTLIMSHETTVTS